MPKRVNCFFSNSSKEPFLSVDLGGSCQLTNSFTEKKEKKKENKLFHIQEITKHIYIYVYIHIYINLYLFLYLLLIATRAKNGKAHTCKYNLIYIHTRSTKPSTHKHKHTYTYIRTHTEKKEKKKTSLSSCLYTETHILMRSKQLHVLGHTPARQVSQRAVE